MASDFENLLKCPHSKLNINVISAAMQEKPEETLDYLLNLINDGVFSLDISRYIKMLDDKKTSEKYWIKYFDTNPQKVCQIIPKEYITYEMSGRILLLTGSLKMVPVWHRKFSLTKAAVNFSVTNMSYIFANGSLIKGVPLSDEEQKQICELAYEQSPIALTYSPKQYTTIERWHKLIREDYNYITLCPSEFVTKELWREALSNDILILDKMPVKHIDNEQAVINYFSGLSSTMMDDNLLTVIISKLKTVKNQGVVGASDDVVSIILNKEPKVLKSFKNEIVNSVILNELLNIAKNKSGTIREIAEKYDVTVATVGSVLEIIKDTQIELYDKIKEVLGKKQDLYSSNMVIDISKLNSIICFLGINDRKVDSGLTNEDKVKFSYLGSKYLNNSLEEIYKFNLNSGSKFAKDYYRQVDEFFSKFLHFDLIYNDSTTDVLESDIYTLNDSWLKLFDIDKFFAIKDDRPTIEHFYLSKENHKKQFTIDIANDIVDILRLHNIPLIHIIVRQAFRAYFTGKLDEYLKQFISYEEEFIKFSSNNI